MKRQIYGLLGVVAIAALGAACKDDPLSDTGGSLSRLDLESAYREVIIGDSIRTFAIERDALNTPLPPTATVRSCNAAIASVSPVSDAPLQRTGFFVKAVTYGSTCVIAESGALVDTMQVSTFPASIVITSGPDTVVSGVGNTYTYQFRDRAGNAVSDVPVPTWTVSDPLLATVTAAGGVLSGRDTGVVTVSVTGTGSPPGGVTASKGVLVRPAAFNATMTPNPADPGQVVNFTRDAAGPTFDSDTRIFFGATQQTFVSGSLTADSVKVAIPDLASSGVLAVRLGRFGPGQVTQTGGVFTVNTPATVAGTVTPTSGVPTDTVKITRGGGEPLFDSNSRAYVAGVQTFIALNTPDSILVIVPGIGSTGAKELRLTRLDAADLARKTTFTSNTASFADLYDAVNDDPATAPNITANGDYYVILSGSCVNGVGGADCDDFFQITNTGGTDVEVTVNMAWFTAADIDGYGLDPTFDFCTFDGGCPAATGANPEQFKMTVPAGETWFIYLNLWVTGGSASTLTRVRVSGLP